MHQKIKVVKMEERLAGFTPKEQDELLDMICSIMQEQETQEQEMKDSLEAQKEDSLALKSSINELGAEMSILWSGLRRPRPSEIEKMKQILDPNNSGFYEYSAFLSVMADKTKEIERNLKSKRRLDGSYKLRPRDLLKCPRKWTGFDSITYSSCNDAESKK